jgi:hypothetical protein
MRKLIRVTASIFFSLALLLSIAPVPSAVSQPSSPSDRAHILGDARLSLIQGDVAIQTKDTGSEWGAASINTPVTPGTRVWVPENARTEIQFLGGSYLRAGENTDVDVTDLTIDSQNNIIQVVVPQGRTYINYGGSNAKDSVFQVDSPVASTRAYGTSKFKVDVYEDGYTEVSVISGAVYVEAQTGSTKVDAGSTLSIDGGQNAELSPMRAADSWDQWNQSRDSALAGVGPSRRYLPATLDVYGNDFDAHGRWVNTADYGYVWTPIGAAVDWAPYRAGRWCWIGGDYVWVSYEPWGWVPYHYGRWAFIRNTGWCWVPPPATAVYWGPGFVAWINTPTYVSWVPLAPREIYYGRGYYGPHSVNIANVNINRVNITNVYVNAKFVNAVTVVHRRTFLTGRAERVADAPKNPFTAGVKPSIGRPDIKPDRATAFPNPLKVVAEKKLPRREIVKSAEKIRNRPVAVHKDISVFKPGKQATSMRVDRIERPKPITSVQKPEPGKSRVQRGEAGKAPAERREIVPPSEQRGQRSGPSTQREFGVAPPQRGEPSAPPARREQMNKPSAAPSTATPQTQRPQPMAPKKEQMGPAPAQRRDLNPPGQMSRPTPPAIRRESSPPAQTTRPVPPAPKGPSRPSVQRNMGVAPPHVGQPSAPPAPSRPQGVAPGTSSKGVKDKDNR